MEQAVLIDIPLAAEFGTDEERQALVATEDRIIEVLGSTGELDGNEFGDSRCRFYLYGPDANAIWDKVAPVVAEAPLPRPITVEVRYGPPGADGRTVTVD